MQPFDDIGNDPGEIRPPRFRQFSKTLRRLSFDANKSRHDIAEVLGVTSAAIGKYYRGETLPSPDNLKKLAAMFDVDVEAFLGDDRGERVPRRPQAMGLINSEGGHHAELDIRRMVEREVRRRFDRVIRDVIDAHMPAILDDVRRALLEKPID